jgi:hypothetical protein
MAVKAASAPLTFCDAAYPRARLRRGGVTAATVGFWEGSMLP